MTDIYDIKDIVFPLPVSVFNTVLVIVIFLIIYFLLFKRSHPSFLLSKEEEQDQKTDYRELINEFEKNYMSLNSSNFLKETSFIFRGFLEQDLGYENFSKYTLKEIYEAKSGKLKVGSQINHIFKVLENIYFKEYKEENLTKKEKEKIFLEVKDIILNEEN